MRILRPSHSAKKCKRGTLSAYLTLNQFQSMQTKIGGALGALKKNSRKKSHSAEKT